VLDCNKEFGSKKVAACEEAMKPSNDLFKALLVNDGKIPDKPEKFTRKDGFKANAEKLPL